MTRVSAAWGLVVRPHTERASRPQNQGETKPLPVALLPPYTAPGCLSHDILPRDASRNEGMIHLVSWDPGAVLWATTIHNTSGQLPELDWKEIIDSSHANHFPSGDFRMTT